MTRAELYHDNRTDYSNEISVSVSQYYGLNLVAPGARGEVSPGGSYFCPHTITNIGNGSDLFKLELANTTSGWTSTLIKDDNMNGIHDPSENTQVETEIPLAEDASYYLFVVLTAPANARKDDLGSTIFTVSGRSDDGGTYQGANGLFYGGPDSGQSQISAVVTHVDVTPPTITNFFLDGRKRFPEDIISLKPLVSARITDEVPNNVGKIELSVNNAQIFTFTSADWKGAYNEADGSFSYQLGPFEPGTFTIKLFAWDKSNNQASETLTPLYIRTDVGVVGQPVNYPNPFGPLKGQVTYIAYTLSKDLEVTLYIYDIRGSAMWRRTFQPFEEGGKAGYNEVTWNGRSDFKQVLGNGIYIFKLVHNQQVIGSGKITILDRK